MWYRVEVEKRINERENIEVICVREIECISDNYYYVMFK